MTLAVFIHGRRAGTLHEARSRVVFSYTEEYLRSGQKVPLSVSAPLAPGTSEVTAWLDGLLPDNSEVRERWAREHRAVSPSPIHLLASPVGLDCAGAVQFCAADRSGSLPEQEAEAQPLSEQEVGKIIDRLMADRSSWSAPGLPPCFSLAGAQSKIALRFDAGGWSAPRGKAPTTHILKPAVRGYPDQDIIEHLTQRTAALLGLDAASTECLEIAGRRTLLVKRYDRQMSADVTKERIHQEDLCQALELHPKRKYQWSGGPSVADIANLLAGRSACPDDDLCLFRDALIYNWLIVGTDAHAKNFGLLLTAQGARLAPLYDMCSMLPYRELADSSRVSEQLLPMKIGRDYTLFTADYVKAWQRTSRALGLAPRATAARAVALAEALPGTLDQAINELPPRLAALQTVDVLRAEIALRAAHCATLPRMKRPTKGGDGRGRLEAQRAQAL